MSKQAVQTMNKKKHKLHKKKRADVKNFKKVAQLQKGKVKLLTQSVPSKKKQKKNAKRRRIYIEAEKTKLLKSGLVTEEDLQNLNETGEVMEVEEHSQWKRAKWTQSQSIHRFCVHYMHHHFVAIILCQIYFT